MSAAIELIIIFQAVAYNARATMFARRRQLPDSAFEAVKGVASPFIMTRKALS
jgi:hypothetical protein